VRRLIKALLSLKFMALVFEILFVIFAIVARIASLRSIPSFSAISSFDLSAGRYEELPLAYGNSYRGRTTNNTSTICNSQAKC
jgi:hypothetical protein